MEGLGVGVVVGAGRGQEADVVGQHRSPSVRVGEVAQAEGDQSLSRSESTEHVQAVLTSLEA